MAAIGKNINLSIWGERGLNASPVSMSVVTAAVRPTPDEPRPVVAIARWATCSTKRRNCDLATDGSPISSRLMSPRMRDPFDSCRSTPPSSSSKMARLICSWPWIDGAIERVSRWTTSCGHGVGGIHDERTVLFARNANRKHLYI